MSADHKTCGDCRQSLTGKRFVIKEKLPVCKKCYDTRHADICSQSKCNKKIGMDCKDLTYKGKHWHEECFTCAECSDSIANREFVPQGGLLFCVKCYDQNFGEKCDECNKIFKHGMQKFEYKEKKYHLSCFLCMDCMQPICNNSFVPNPKPNVSGDDNKRMCMNCYNRGYANKCQGCQAVIVRGGLMFRDYSYHTHCFTCNECTKELSNEQFIVKDEAPYCPDCYVKKFNKICEKCDKSISNVGTPQKYVAFNQRQWHSECFVCNGCSNSLIGQGFLVANNNVYCPACSKTA